MHMVPCTSIILTSGHAPDMLAYGVLRDFLSNFNSVLYHLATVFAVWPHEAGHFMAPGETQGPLQQQFCPKAQGIVYVK